MSDELIRADATGIVARLKTGELTPHELLDALEARIAKVNGPVNALPRAAAR
jgi:amidase